VIAAVSYRENPADWLLIKKEKVAENQPFRLPKEAIVGTSSARRKAQLLDFRSDVQLQDIRGNVPTRVEKLRAGDFDAILLAGAGLSRLNFDLSDLEVIKLHPKEFVPAPAQGVLAWQCLESDIETRRLLQRIHRPEVSAVTNVERKVLKLIGGGCHLPLGVYCERDIGGNYHVRAAMADAWNQPLQRIRLSSSTSYGLAEKVLEGLKR
jgi:hydroxymethylbilane synthase